MKRILAVLLLTLSLLLLFSCNRDTDTDNTGDGNRSVVFRGEEITFPDGWGLEMTPNISYSGDTLTAILRHKTGENEYGASIYEKAAAYYTWDGEMLTFSAFADGQTQSTGRNQTYALADGTTAVVACVLDPAETYLTVTVSQDENILFTAHPADALGYNLSRDVGNMAGDVFSVLDVRAVVHGESMLYVILTSEGLYAVHPDGTTAFTVRDAYDPTSLLEHSGELFYMTRKQDGSGSLRRVDLTAGKLSDTVEMPGEIMPTEMTGIQPTFIGSDIGLFAYNGRGIYEISMTQTEGEDGGYKTEATLFLDWLESGIVFRTYNTKIAVVNDTTVVVAETDYHDKDDFGTISVYRMVPADRIPEKEALVIANLGGTLSAQTIIDFNRSSDTIRVVERDYTVYPEDQRKLAFDTDIAAGNIPDIVIMTADSVDGTLVNTYEASDLFCDLTPLMQANPDFRYDDLLSYVTKPYQFMGEQRLFPLHANPYTYFARSDDADAPLTPEESLALSEAHLAKDAENAICHYSDTDLHFRGALSSHYDYENAVCSFDDPALADVIERARALGNGFDYFDNENVDKNMLFREGKVLFASALLPKSLYDYVTAMKNLGAETPDDVTMIGYPNEEGVCCVSGSDGTYFAVTEASEFKAECIKLLSAHLTQTKNAGGDLLLTRTAVYYRSDITDELARYDGMTIVQEDRSIWVVTDEEAESRTGVKFKITREWADAFCEMLDSVTARIVSTRTPEKVFYEELRRNPERSIKETLDIVQSRVSIYLSEQFG